MKRELMAGSIVTTCILFVSVPAFAGWKEFHQQQKAERKAHFEQQKQENEQFREANRNTAKEEKVERAVEHRKQQHEENKEFFQKQHEENMAFLKERLADAKRLTDEEKNEIISFFEQQYAENVSFREERFNDLIAQFQKIAMDETMKVDEKKEAIKAMLSKWREATKAHWEQQKSERKEQIESLKKKGEGE